jgi:hypothetical protein
MRWVEHVTSMSQMINECGILIGKPGRKRNFGDQA